MGLLAVCILPCRTLGEVVGNFPSFLEEVTMAADPESIRLKNYCGEDSQCHYNVSGR